MLMQEESTCVCIVLQFAMVEYSRGVIVASLSKGLFLDIAISYNYTLDQQGFKQNSLNYGRNV